MNAHRALCFTVASAAVPGILNAVVLMQKSPDGSLRPMNWGSKFKDGSLRVDIPLESLHLLFNVNYSIVSQGGWQQIALHLGLLTSPFFYRLLVNPHVHRECSSCTPSNHRLIPAFQSSSLLRAALWDDLSRIEREKVNRRMREWLGRHGADHAV